MITKAIVILILISVQVEAKRVSKTVKLKDFPRDGPFIFMTKMLLGPGNSLVDINYQ